MKKLIMCLMILALPCIGILTLTADQLSDVQQQKNNVDNKINSISKQKQQAQKSLSDIKAQKSNIDSSKKQQKKELETVTNAIKDDDDESRSLTDALSDEEDKYEKQKEQLKIRLKVMYENSNTSYLLTLLESKTITDFFDKLQLISLISKNDKQLIAQIETSQKDLQYKKQKIDEEKAALQSKAKEKLVAMSSLEISRASADEKERAIRAKLDQLEKEEDELNNISDELVGQIRQFQSKGTKYAGGSMTWPVPSSSYISSGYGMRLHPILKKYRMHTGIDISASLGKSIVAANNGTVAFSGWQDGYGYTLIIDHGGGITTLYAHCSKLLVSVGDKVTAGQVVAKVGSTGLSTGPHCHFEVRKDGETQDPTNYVSPS